MMRRGPFGKIGAPDVIQSGMRLLSAVFAAPRKRVSSPYMSWRPWTTTCGRRFGSPVDPRPQPRGILVMFERLKEYWSELGRGRPGSRFQEQYDNERRRNKSSVARGGRIVVGLLLLPIGVFFMAVPGPPGFVVIAIGAVLIAREFGFAAHVLDAVELRGRQVYKGIRRLWRKLVSARRKVVR
jgi:hypothetical protein